MSQLNALIPWLVSFLIFVGIVDGIKLLLELLWGQDIIRLRNSYNDLSVIVSCYNEEDTISTTIASLKRAGINPNNILVMEDGSSDGTWGVVRWEHPDVSLYTWKNKGKVESLRFLLGKVLTKYVMVIDADIELADNFYIPLYKLDEGTTAIAFNVMPMNKPKNLFSRLLVNLQKHEYNKSMSIGRRSKNSCQSVSCVSGAAGVYLTNRLKQLDKHHSGVFSGEDLQRTMIELLHNGKVIFIDSIVYTDVPTTLSGLTKQRVNGWWGGLYHCFPLFWKLLIYKKSSPRLRLEMLYDMTSLILDPLKVVCLFFLSPMQILIVYVAYLVLEGLLMGVKSPITLLFYPLYSFYQMTLRMIAFLHYFNQRFITKKWNKLTSHKTIGMILPLLLLSIGAFAQDVVTKTTTEPSPSKISVSVGYNKLVRNEKQYDQLTAYAGYNKVFVEASLIKDNWVSAGIYYKKGYAYARHRAQDLVLYAQDEFARSGNHGFIISDRVGYLYAKEELMMTPGLTWEWYISDGLQIQTSFLQNIGVREDSRGEIKLLASHNKWWIRTGAGVNTYWQPNYHLTTGYKYLYVVASYDKNFDYSNYEQFLLGVGIKATL